MLPQEHFTAMQKLDATARGRMVDVDRKCAWDTGVDSPDNPRDHQRLKRQRKKIIEHARVLRTEMFSAPHFRAVYNDAKVEKNKKAMADIVREVDKADPLNGAVSSGLGLGLLGLAALVGVFIYKKVTSP